MTIRQTLRPGLALTLILAAGLGLSACGKKEEAPAKPRASLTITATAARVGTLERSVEASGTVVAWQDVQVGAETGGLTVVRLLAEEGDYVRQGQLTCALRAAYNHKEVVLRRGGSDEDEAETPPTVLEIVQQVRFLVLDEIGCHSLANDERLLLDELIKHRYEQNKPTILISNLALDQLKEFLGDAPSDRIACATGNGKFVLQFSGESYRRTVKEDYLSGLNRSPNTVSSVAGGKSTP